MRNVVLIGFMGVGKTSVGQELSRRLGWPFYDTDELIQRRTGRTIPELFELHGEATFRAVEREVVAEVSRICPAVIACGGGVALDPVNVAELRRRGRIVLLEATLLEILDRVGDGGSRPLLQGDPARRASHLLAQRSPRYRAVADLVVDTTGRAIPEVAQQILERLMELERRTVWVELPAHRYPVHVGEGILPSVAQEVLRTGVRRVALLTHPHLLELYGERLCMALRAWGIEPHPITVLPGERSKTLTAARKVYEAMAAFRLDRTSGVLTLGGGVVGDLGGFVAGTYMRGVPLFQLPTTLLAQVDASVGGKAALNVVARNLVGVFWQPQAVVADVGTLRTLASRQFRAGLAEAIKHAAIADAPLFVWLETHLPKVVRRRPEALIELVARNVAIKAGFVAADDRETSGVREALNFGHTVAHALEAATNYRVPHGDAVAIGMVAEAQVAVRLGLLPQEEAHRLRALLASAGLPVQAPDIPATELVGRMVLDKKARSGRLRFSLIDRIGNCRTGVEVEPTLLVEVLRAMQEAGK